MEPEPNNENQDSDDININITYDTQESGDDFFNGDPVNNLLESVISRTNYSTSNIIASNLLLTQMFHTINEINMNSDTIFNYERDNQTNGEDFNYNYVDDELIFPSTIEIVFNFMMGSFFDNVLIDPINDAIQRSYNEQPESLVKTDRIIEIEGKIYKEIEDELKDISKDCSICSDNFEDNSLVSITYCGHIFHKDCIVEWGKYKTNCPICRESLEEEKKEKE